jgi:hypothetical protein
MIVTGLLMLSTLCGAQSFITFRTYDVHFNGTELCAVSCLPTLFTDDWPVELAAIFGVLEYRSYVLEANSNFPDWDVKFGFSSDWDGLDPSGLTSEAVSDAYQLQALNASSTLRQAALGAYITSSVRSAEDTSLVWCATEGAYTETCSQPTIVPTTTETTSSIEVTNTTSTSMLSTMNTALSILLVPLTVLWAAIFWWWESKRAAWLQKNKTRINKTFRNLNIKGRNK